jgi:predicted esterase
MSAACGEDEDPVNLPSASREGRLELRPAPPVETVGRAGSITLQVAPGTPAASAYVPEGSRPMRLVLFLHGAGGAAAESVKVLMPFADENGLLLVAAQSVRSTWDVIAGGFGPDVHNIDRLLEAVTVAYPVDSLTVAGFSDGASYALSLGIGNGDVFDSVLALSPGFSAARVSNGRPRFFVSHGTQDQVLPIDRCSRRIVPALERGGYDVTYEEFDGGHTVPPAIKHSAMDWLTKR